MSVVNRLLVVIIALLILAGAVVTFLVSVGLSTPDILPNEWFKTELENVASGTVGRLASIIIVSVLIVLAMMVFLFFEFIPLRKRASFLISSSEIGITSIDEDSICELARKSATIHHDVQHVKCRVQEKTGGLVLYIQASLNLRSDVAKVSNELQNEIKEVVEELTSLKVKEVHIKARYESGEAKHLVVR